jgi:hypothetical protein
MPKTKNDVNHSEMSEATSLNNVKDRHRTRMESLIEGSTIVAGKDTISPEEELEGGSLPADSIPNTRREFASLAPSNRGSAQFPELKTRLTEVETSITILREMIDSKVNFSDIVKLQESKCSKLTFK